MNVLASAVSFMLHNHWVIHSCVTQLFHPIRHAYSPCEYDWMLIFMWAIHLILITTDWQSDWLSLAIHFFFVEGGETQLWIYLPPSLHTVKLYYYCRWNDDDQEMWFVLLLGLTSERLIRVTNLIKHGITITTSLQLPPESQPLYIFIFNVLV